MIDLKKDIDSLSNFKRESSKFIRRMKSSGSPVVLTINGKAELVVQDAASYQRLLDKAARYDASDTLRQSLDDVAKGRTRPLRQALEQLGNEE
jgi:PHD/YefM family antitoxin component YafN of YafNO toxin-antitoxin module